MTYLSAILERKRREAAQLSSPHVEPSRRSFIHALRQRSPSLIAEVKPRSPSGGFLLDRANVPSVVQAYSAHAQAISVLCDTEDFGGGFDLLEQVRSLTDLPILAKEFIVDPAQIRMARAAGADAILLIGAALRAQQIQELADLAASLSMTVLFELHDETDLEKIPKLGPDQLVLGINNRNLSTLTIDLSVTQRLAPILRQRYPEYLLISESGVKTREDVRSLSKFVDGFLIGESFLRSEDPSAMIRSLFPRSRVKICGITREEDLDLCEHLGVEYVGFNFVPSSPRCLSMERARELGQRVERATTVALFVDEDLETVRSTVAACGASIVQLHGSEGVAYIEALDMPVIKAYRSVPSIAELKMMLDIGAWILLDGPKNGSSADLGLVADFPMEMRERMFLAGGLNPTNVAAVVDRIQPFAVDVASGIESAPGVKDHEMLKEFVCSTRDTARGMRAPDGTKFLQKGAGIPPAAVHESSLFS